MAVNSAKDVPFHAAQSFRWWRLAVYVYVPALILTVVSSLLKWDATVTEAAKANNIEVSAAQTSLAVSFAFAILAQTATAIACWWLAGKLLVASIIAATATAQSYRGERNQKFFVTT